MESPRFTLLTSHNKRKKDPTSVMPVKLPKLKVKYGPQTPILAHANTSNQLLTLRNFHSQSPRYVNKEKRCGSPQVTFIELLIDKYEKSKKNNIDLASTFVRPEEIHVYWNTINPVGFIPDARSGTTMNVFNRNIFIFSGEKSGESSDLNKFDYKSLTWQRITPNNTSPSEIPVLKCGHISGNYKNNIVIYGGFTHFDPILQLRNCSSLVYFFDTLSLKWKSYKPTGHVPEPRRNHLGVVVGRSLFIYSGVNSKGELIKGMSVLDLEAMHWGNPHIKGDIPVTRKGASLTAIYHPSLSDATNFDIYKVPKVHDHLFTKQTSGIYLFGGRSEDGRILNDLHVLRGQRSKTKPGVLELIWTKLIPGGEQPIGRYNHCACLCTTFLIIMGGQNDSYPGTFLNDIIILRVNSWRWDPVRLHNSNIPGRINASCVSISSKLILFGGMTSEGFASTSILELEVDQKKVSEIYGIRRESVLSYLQ